MKKVVVFHIISHFDLGGAETVAFNIAQSSNPLFEYHILEVIRGRGEYSDQFRSSMEKCGIHVHRAFLPADKVHLFSKLAIILFPLYFLPLYFKYRPSVIHSHTEIPDTSLWIVSRLFPRLISKCRIVRTIHNNVLWSEHEKLGCKVEKFFNSHNANISISSSVQESYKKVYDISTPIIFNGVPVKPQIKWDSLSEGQSNVLFAGRFESQKGIDTLIKIIKSVSSDQRYFFHIVGSGSMEDLIRTELSGLQNVRIYPPVSGLSAYMSSFDFLLMPSVFEGLAMMSIEASMTGLPVIINNCKGLADTLPENWPLSVTDNNLESYIRIFEEVLPSIDVSALKKTAYNYVASRFSIEQMQKAYESFYLSNEKTNDQ